MKKRILITGGAGFLGSHLCELLSSSDHHVICLDNFFTGRHDNLDGFDYKLEVVRHDVCDPFHFEVDEIFHLACPASPVHYQRNPVRTIKTCVQGTLNALELARETGARLLIASTSEVYGDPQVHPQVESYQGNVNPVGPRACYDEGKRCAEALASSYAQQYDVDVRIARIFNCYGPRMSENDGRVVSNFICQALKGDPLTIFGDGSQTRSFIYVDDLIDGLAKLMHSDYGQPVNLGNPVEHTVKELAEMVIKLVGEGSVLYRPLPVDDPTRRRPDIAKANEILGWSPTISIDEGLSRTLEYFQASLQ